ASLTLPAGSNALFVRVDAEDAAGHTSRAQVPAPAPVPSRLRAGSKGVWLVTLPEGGELELVHVPPGPFVMGAEASEAAPSAAVEHPKHKHLATSGTWIGRTHVTWRQFLAFCEATGHPRPDRPRWA